MTETENVPDRAQRERELYELRAKGLATNQVQKFEDLSSRSRRKIDYENVIFASLDQNTPARKIMNHSMMQQFGNTLAYDYENFEITQSISTESIDSNGPFIYTYDKGGDAASTTSTVSSITFYNKTSRNFDKSELGSMHPWQSEIPFGVENDSSGGLLGIMGGLEDIMRGLEEEEEIIFEPMSPRGSSHTRVPTLFMYCSKPAPLSPQDPPVGEKTDYGKSFCMPSKSAESGFYPKSCVSNKNSKMSTSPTSESSCIQKTKPFLPFWKRYLKPSRQYENMRGSGEECGRTNDDQFFVYRKFNNSSKFCFFLVAASLFAAATGLGGFVLLLMVGEEKKHDTTTMVEPTSDANPENDHSSRLQSLRDIVGSLSGFHSLDDPLKPQFMALNWLASKDAAELDLEYEMYKTLAERYLISLLYFATNGEMWTEQYSFLSSKHICEWNEAVPYDEKEFYPSNETGIICDQDGNVAEIVLAENNLEGSLPSELSSLGSLQHLFLPGNQLFGNIPSHLGLLTKLRSIHLGANQLEAHIPTEIGWLKNLKKFDVSSNFLSGAVPIEFGELTDLKSVVLADNKLEGPLPSAMGKLEIDVLNLRGNNFMGDLDPDFCGDREYLSFWADCLSIDALVTCSCCTTCCDKDTCCNGKECCVLNEDSKCIVDVLMKEP